MFLPVEALRGGDVVLTGPQEPDWICRATRSSFNHAFVWNETGHPFICEATPEHCGLSIPHLAVDVSGRTYLDYPRIAHLRHPELARLSKAEQSRFDELFAGLLVGRYSGWDYPRFEKLYRCAKLSFLSWFARSFLRDLDGRNPDQLAEGAFCSSLVCMVFDDLEMPIIKNKASIHRITPGDLLKCKLKQIEHSTVDAIRVDRLQTEQIRESTRKALAALKHTNRQSNLIHRIGKSSLEEFRKQHPSEWSSRSDLSKKSTNDVRRECQTILSALQVVTVQQAVALAQRIASIGVSKPTPTGSIPPDRIVFEAILFISIIYAYAIDSSSTMAQRERQMFLSFYWESLTGMTAHSVRDIQALAKSIEHSGHTFGGDIFTDRQFNTHCYPAKSAEAALIRGEAVAVESLAGAFIGELVRFGLDSSLTTDARRVVTEQMLPLKLALDKYRAEQGV